MKIVLMSTLPFLITAIVYSKTPILSRITPNNDTFNSKIQQLRSELKVVKSTMDEFETKGVSNSEKTDELHKVIDNLGSAYAPISVISSLIGIVAGLIGILVGIAGVIAAVIVYRMGKSKEAQVNTIWGQKHTEMLSIIEAEKQRMDKALNETMAHIKDQEAKREKGLAEYQDYLKKKIENFELEIEKKGDSEKIGLQKQLDELRERVFNFNNYQVYGATGLGASAINLSGAVTSGSGTVTGSLNAESGVLCGNCHNFNVVSVSDRIIGFKKCQHCTALFKV